MLLGKPNSNAVSKVVHGLAFILVLCQFWSYQGFSVKILSPVSLFLLNLIDSGRHEVSKHSNCISFSLRHDLEWMWELVFSKECWQGYLVHNTMKDLYCTELRTLWAFVASFKIRATGFAHFARPPLQKIHILLGVMSGEYFACSLQMKSWRPSMCKHSFFL